MWPFKKKGEEELQELRVPYQEPGTNVHPVLGAGTLTQSKEELVSSKLDTIIAKLESIEQRLRNLER